MSSSHSSALLPETLKYLPLDTPWATNFLATLRQLSALTQDNPIPGNALSGKEENFRLSQAVSLAFPASEVASMCWQKNQLAIKLYSLGIWGPQGPMPLHFSELALTRFQQQDSALIDFIDLFHHRSMAIFFRAWYAAQDTASLDRPDQDRFSFYLRCLAGLTLSDTLSPSQDQHQLLSTAFHLARKNCAPQDLILTLKALFHLPFEIEEFQAGWINLNAKEQSQLTHQAQLGTNALLGEASYQSGHRFKVWCGPLSYEQYCSLHPDKPKLASISNTIQRLTGGNYHYDIHLVLAVPHIPSMTLSGNRQLGFNVWLMNETTDVPQLGMIYTSPLSAD